MRPDPVEVVLAVAAGAALGALRLDQAAALVDAEVLDAGPGQLGCDRDRVDRAPARAVRPSSLPPGSGWTLCVVTAMRYIKPVITNTGSRRPGQPIGGRRMLMRTDPFREFDRLAQQVLGAGRPAARR